MTDAVWQEWAARQDEQAREAAQWEESTRARLDARRAALAARQARQADEIAEIQHVYRLALMGGGAIPTTEGEA
ncbi:hypothetical protein [Actinoplanes sp. NPDC049802]|uniref:hypothetical protein n=1 Tax=Actinoplanes sp. NPDC049802 TaxID=3154742 RepID=UPI0033CD4B48